MSDGSLSGKILKEENWAEASLTIPVGDYNITVISDDNCGAGNGSILRSELFVHLKSSDMQDNINKEIFGDSFVIATSTTLLKAIDYVRGK